MLVKLRCGEKGICTISKEVQLYFPQRDLSQGVHDAMQHAILQIKTVDMWVVRTRVSKVRTSNAARGYIRII